MKAGMQIIDIGIKNLKLLSNVREIDIQYRLQIKYPNPKNHPTKKLLRRFLSRFITKI